MESSQVLQTNSTETNTDTTVSLIPLPDVEPMESSVAAAVETHQPPDTTVLNTTEETPGNPTQPNNVTSIHENSVDIPPEPRPCTSRTTQEVAHLADQLPLCYALSYPDAVGLQIIDGVWHVYSATDTYLQRGSSANIDTGVVLYSNDHTAMQIDGGPYGAGRFEVQAALLSDQDFGNLWVQVTNTNQNEGLWIRKGEPIGVISFQEIKFPNPLLVDIKELTVFLAQLLETKRKKKFSSSPSHIPGFNYPSTATSLEVFPSSMDDAVSTVPPTSEMQETAVDLSVNGDLNLDDTDDDYPLSEVPSKRNKQQ
ncbi:unnamed protein product [Orchesella dallaii]|uniref:Uncharacterized protein n=1 Tax=Orchesella dallaii TaxID=48710 RepID=A0ABP1R1K5_9HEXA